MKLVIPMAGRGTRVRPHSHVTPKPLLPVLGRTLVERIVDTFNRVLPDGLDEGVFILGPDFGQDIRDQLTAICEARGMTASFGVQPRAEGTAHAVGCAGDRLEGEGIVIFADTLFEMEPDLDLEGADVVAWVKHVEDPSRFGVAVREGERIVAFVEKPKELISNEALIGIYYVRDLAGLRETIQGLIDDDVRGAGGEFQLTDAFDRLLKQGKVFKTASVTDWLDCGTIPALLDTTKFYLTKAEADGDDLHHGQVKESIVFDPVYIAPGAIVTGAVVGPNVSIEAGAHVNGAIVRDSIVFADARVEGLVLRDSLIGRDAEVNVAPRTLNVGDHSTVS